MRNLVALACVGLLTAGCATGRINSGWPFPVEPAAPTSASGYPLRQMQISLAHLLEGRLKNDGVEIVVDDSGAAVPRDRQEAVLYVSSRPDPKLDQLVVGVRQAKHPKEVRNDVVGAWMAASTANCTVYVQALRSGQVVTRMSSDFLSGGLAAAASLATPESSARLLSALSSFATATGATVDRNIFAQQGAELVADSILQLREERATQLKGKMRQSYDEWPMPLAMKDLFDYHGDCSMLRGFARMRDAILVREQTVQTIREATAAVARSGGSPAQMMAVVGVLQSGTPAPAEIPVQLGGDWDSDLEALMTDGSQCLSRAKASAKDAANTEALRTSVFKTDPTCVSDDSWLNRYHNVAAQALADNAGALDAALALPKGANVPDAPSDATGEVKAAAAAEKEEAKKTEATRQQAIDAAFALIAQSYDQRASALVEKNVNVRRIAMTQLENWRGSSAAQVAEMLKQVGGTDFVSETSGVADPVFDYALVAANAVAAKAPADGTAAAVQALAAGRAVIERSRRT